MNNPKIGVKALTLVATGGYPVGTKVKVSSNKAGELIHGAVTPEKVMCTMPNGGGLYYLPSELEVAS